MRIRIVFVNHIINKASRDNDDEGIYISKLLFCTEKKSAVLVTASPASTIIEECIQLIRKLHCFTNWTEPINSLVTSYLAIATDLLVHPLLPMPVTVIILYFIISRCVKFLRTR